MWGDDRKPALNAQITSAGRDFLIAWAVSLTVLVFVTGPAEGKVPCTRLGTDVTSLPEGPKLSAFGNCCSVCC